MIVVSFAKGETLFPRCMAISGWTLPNFDIPIFIMLSYAIIIFPSDQIPELLFILWSVVKESSRTRFVSMEMIYGSF